MCNKTMRSLVLLAATMALLRPSAIGAEALPPRALARIGDHRFYHGPGITCAVLSPDGRRIASAANYPNSDHIAEKERNAYNRLIVLWDAATGGRLREMRVPHAPISRLGFSPDGKWLAAVYDISDGKYGVVVFDVETGKLLRQLADFKRRVTYLQFSADGKQLRVSEWRGPVSAWDAASGKQLRLWKPPPEMPPVGDENGVCGVMGILSPDNKVVTWGLGLVDKNGVYRGSTDLRVHDADTDKLLYEKKFKFPDHCYPESLAFSTDGKRFASEGIKLIVWETATGKELVALEVPNLVHFALAPDGRRAAIYQEEEAGSRLRLWNLEIGKPSGNLYLGFVPLLYDLLDKPQVFSADGKKLLLASVEGTLHLFDTRIGIERGEPYHRAAVAPRFSADGRTLFTSCGERRCSWDVSSGRKPTLLTHERRKAWEVKCLAHSADERHFLDSSEDRVRVYDKKTGRVLRELEGNNRTVVSGRFSPDATRVLLCLNPALFRLCDTKTGRMSGTIEAADPEGEPVFSPNGRLVAWSDCANVIQLHDGVTGKGVRTLRSSRPLPEVESEYAVVLFSPDSEYVIEGRPTLPMRVFQVSSSREIARFYANPDKANNATRLSCLACSPDNRLLAVAEYESGIVRVIEIAGGKVRAEFVGHRHGVHGLAFAPDGKTLASGGEDNVVFLWDVTGAKTLPTTAENLTSGWNDLASEDGKRAGIAIASFLRKPEASVAFLQERLHPAKATDEKRLAQLLADLDADAYQKRETASRELIRLGERAEAALRCELMNRPSLEVRRRIEDVLSKLEPSPLPLEMLQALRGIEVLEHIGTPAARRCLEALTKGAAEARQTREAKATLRRLTKRRG